MELQKTIGVKCRVRRKNFSIKRFTLRVAQAKPETRLQRIRVEKPNKNSRCIKNLMQFLTRFSKVSFVLTANRTFRTFMTRIIGAEVNSVFDA